MSAFNDAVRDLKPGDGVTCPPPVALSGVKVEKIFLMLKSKAENGLMTFDVSQFGIKLGALTGKADGSMSGWRFESGE